MQMKSGPKIEMKTFKIKVLSALLSFIYDGQAVIQELIKSSSSRRLRSGKFDSFCELKGRSQKIKPMLEVMGLVEAEVLAEVF